MPKIHKLAILDITPEQFVNACSAKELLELQRELDLKIRHSGSHKAYLERLKVTDPMTYSEMTSDPTN